MREAKLKIQISKVIRAKDPLHSVARGCLIAAKTQEEGKHFKDVKETTVEGKTETKKKVKKKK